MTAIQDLAEELSFDNLVKDEPFVLWGNGLVTVDRYHGASTTYADARVIGNPLLGLIRVWRDYDEPGIILNVQHLAHSLTVAGGCSRFTYWTVSLDGDFDSRTIFEIARKIMNGIVESVTVEMAECESCHEEVRLMDTETKVVFTHRIEGQAVGTDEELICRNCLDREETS